MADEKGLYVLIQPSGEKLWRLKYRHLGKEKKLSFGRYPHVTLKEARSERDAARKTIASGIDPAEVKRADKLARLFSSANTFGLVGAEFIEKMDREGKARVTISKARWMLGLFEPAIGKLPIDQIVPADILAPLKKLEKLGQLETARRMRSLASRIFRYAVATSRAKTDPTSVLRGALASPIVKHHAAITDPTKVGALLRAIDGFDGQPMTKLALQLAPHVFVRPGELRSAEWSEIDFVGAVWRIPAAKMKMRNGHEVPLSRQALAILTQAHALTGRYKFVFSSLYPGTRAMSENTLNAALRRMGYSGDEMTAHGFRTIASTLLNESNRWNPDAIERALAHRDKNAVRAAYNRALHWEERVSMAEWWSNHLDGLRSAIS